MLKKTTFPEHEYGSAQKQLDKQGFCYITKVSDRPFFDEMCEEEKEEILKYSENMGLPYEFIRFSRSEDN